MALCFPQLHMKVLQQGTSFSCNWFLIRRQAPWRRNWPWCFLSPLVLFLLGLDVGVSLYCRCPLPNVPPSPFKLTPTFR
ncbi:hypothetical protein SETIT_4G112700v2 [Setaria italica]|uniref:Uncharacterized protein n=2 Tax=Setaria TaxID=4554 RepID=A0A368QT38_SETIT|nr:hypothetical protein SETIT_4G112700v2 [Setaria italica]